MGTHPIFESDFDCLTVFSMSNNEIDFVSSTPLSSPRLPKTDRFIEPLPVANSDMLNALKISIEARNFPKAMNIINELQRFDDIYRAISENELLKIQLSAAEEVSNQFINENKDLKASLMKKENEQILINNKLSEMTEKNERNMKLSNGLSEQLAQKELENTQILNSLEENQTMNSSMCSRLEREIISLKLLISSQKRQISDLRKTISSTIKSEEEKDNRIMEYKRNLNKA